jgi:4-hydroxybenzoyl-CoA reductase alpha subunit
MIGERIPKHDGVYMVTGQAKYLEDIKFPNTLFGKILRSPHPHARILSIDTSRALSLKGVEAVITAEDTPRIAFSGISTIAANKLPLCDRKVRFVGDEVAAVAARDENTALRALELIKVQYEVLPAVFDPEEAMQSGGPTCHDDCVDNIATRFVRSFGNTDRGFEEADFIFEDRFTTPRVVSCTLQPHGCLASFDEAGSLTLWTSTQNIGNFHKGLAQTLNMPMNKVVVINTFVGGAFGNKSVILSLEPIAALLAKKARKPVRIVNSREEEFTTTRTRYSMIMYLKTGVTKEGLLIARECRVVTDNGAYNHKGQAITLLTCSRIGNLYRIPNVKAEAYIVYTNNQCGEALRGWGGPQAHFAIESQMDMIAHCLKIDPLQLRLRNANREGDVTAWGWKITSCGLSECLREAAKAVNWDCRMDAKSGSQRRGKGIASVVHTGGGSVGTHGAGNFEGVSLKVNPDGTIQIIVGIVDIGQGLFTAIIQIVSEDLGVPFEDISIAHGNTQVIPATMGTWGSRGVYICGNAARLACTAVREQLFEIASEMLGTTAAGDLWVQHGLICSKSHPEKHVSIRESVAYCLRKYGRIMTGEAVFNPTNANPPDSETGYGNNNPTYSFGAQAAEVEVDMETGKVDVLGIAAAHDVGKAINPSLVEGQIDGGVSMGMGYALFEELQLQDGVTQNSNFHRYKLVNSTEMPPVKTIIVETMDPDGPFGAKGIGEPTTIPTAPAIANAIFDAVGVRIKELPITPEKIIKALKELELARKEKGEDYNGESD